MRMFRTMGMYGLAVVVFTALASASGFAQTCTTATCCTNEYNSCMASAKGDLDCSSMFGSAYQACYKAYKSEVSACTAQKNTCMAGLTTSVQGWVYPKYKVVGVTYAPPGPSSTVTYTNASTIGTSETLGNSYTSSVTNSVSVSRTLGFKVLGSTITNTASTTISQGSSSSNTVTLNYSTSTSHTTGGTSNAYAPVNHDYDIIYLWVNPALVFTVVTDSTGKDTIQWNGYGYDATDQNDYDIVPVRLGYLTGSMAMPADVASALRRTWAANQDWTKSGSTAAITSQDYAAIAAADPFYDSTYGKNYIGVAPPSPNTSDQRFTISTCNGSTGIQYYQAAYGAVPSNVSCTLSNTTVTAATASTTSSRSYTIAQEISMEGSLFGSKYMSSLLNSYTVTSTSSALRSLTSSTTNTASLYVQEPPCNVSAGIGVCSPVYDPDGAQPVAFDVYQDNLYGTFMFAPVHYYN